MYLYLCTVCFDILIVNSTFPCDFWLIFYKEFTLQPCEFLDFHRDGVKAFIILKYDVASLHLMFPTTVSSRRVGKNMISGAAMYLRTGASN